MATYTSHYNLKKPATSDKIRIADFNGNADTIDATMYENATLGAQLKSAIGIVENTNTATHNISEGNFVIWKGVLKVASSAISSGATLSDANLSSVPNGGLNALNSKFITITGTSSSSLNVEVSVVFPSGWNISNCCIAGWSIKNSTNGLYYSNDPNILVRCRSNEALVKVTDSSYLSQPFSIVLIKT